MEAKNINITGDLLKLYGFEYDSSYDYELMLPDDMGVLLISVKLNRNAVLIQDNDTVSLMVVNYLHELEKVFFAITGKELELKSECSTCN